MNWCYLREGGKYLASLSPAETAESAENALFMSANFVQAEAEASS